MLVRQETFSKTVEGGGGASDGDFTPLCGGGNSIRKSETLEFEKLRLTDGARLCARQTRLPRPL